MHITYLDCLAMKFEISPYKSYEHADNSISGSASAGSLVSLSQSSTDLDLDAKNKYARPKAITINTNNNVFILNSIFLISSSEEASYPT